MASLTKVNQSSSCLDSFLPRNPVTKNRELRLIPESVEIALGSALYPTMIASQGGRSEKKNYQQMLEQVGKQLAQRSDRSELPYEFTVIDSKVENAWCLPGGKIAFYSRLIEKLEAKTDTFGIGAFSLKEKIAAVVAHEITHAAARHSARGLEFGAVLTVLLRGLQVFLAVFTMRQEAEAAKESNPVEAQKKQQQGEIARLVNSVINVFYGVIFKLAISCETRANELEADKFGMVLMKRAGYDPRAALWLQQFFAHEHPQPKNKVVAFVSKIFSSHPPSEERYQRNVETFNSIAAGVLR